MAFITVEDTTSSIDALVFPNVYPQFRDYLTKDAIVYLSANVNLKDGSLSVAVDSVVPIDTFITNPCYYSNRVVKCLEISTTYDRVSKVASLCDDLNALGGNIPIVVKLLDKRQRFVPKSKPKTSLNATALETLKSYGEEFEYTF
jgi:DNA polymerase III alpha subunit